MSPANMPTKRPRRVVQGRYAVLVARWNKGRWQDDLSVPHRKIPEGINA